MLNNWFYSQPSWLVMLAVCATLVALGLFAVFVVQRLVSWERREKDTKMIGLSYALAGSIYAVVIAFVAVGVDDAWDHAQSIANAEVNSLTSLAFTSPALPPDLGASLRSDVTDYVDIVADKEWPAQQAFHIEESTYAPGWVQLQRINQDVATFQAQTPGQATVKQTLIRDVDELSSARRARILAVGEHLPNAVWGMMIFGLVLVIVYLALFGPFRRWIHFATVGLSMLSIGLVFWLIIVLDYPFRSENSVDDDAYLSVKAVTAALVVPASPAPAPATASEAP
jgi:hypothetical protein